MNSRNFCLINCYSLWIKNEMKKSNFSFNSPFCIIASASTSTALASATYSLDQRNFNETLRITLVWIFLLTFLFWKLLKNIEYFYFFPPGIECFLFGKVYIQIVLQKAKLKGHSIHNKSGNSSRKVLTSENQLKKSE